MDSPPLMDDRFWEHLASFSFMGYLKSGVGCCVVKEPPAGTDAEDIVKDLLDYLP